ncbi:MAG: hypothetical protein QF615_07310, partial [Planctomycetota bacterium]|nr:hypothetical protein [Planctomycetota bacterium]
GLALAALTADSPAGLGPRYLRRERAMALVRAGNSSGPAAIRKLLLEDPDDLALMTFLEPGPHPPVPLGPPTPAARDNH